MIYILALIWSTWAVVLYRQRNNNLAGAISVFFAFSLLYLLYRLIDCFFPKFNWITLHTWKKDFRAAFKISEKEMEQSKDAINFIRTFVNEQKIIKDKQKLDKYLLSAEKQLRKTLPTYFDIDKSDTGEEFLSELTAFVLVLTKKHIKRLNEKL